LRTSLILGLGFAMVISVFPFSTWIPIVASETHPYTTGFVFFTLPVVVTLFAFNLYGRYGWLQTSEYTNTAFEMVGLIMIVGGGLWSCFQHNIGRIFGYAIITEIGIFLITFSQILTSIPSDDPANRSIITSLPLTIFFLALLLPRYLNLAIWSFALTIIKEKTKQLDFKSVKGIATEFPIAGISLILASFSLAALPLLAGFPTRLILGIGVGQQSPALGSASLIGYFGLLITTLRMVHTLFHNEKNVPYSLNESRSQTVLLLTGCLVLFVVGIFPQLFLIGLESFSP